MKVTQHLLLIILLIQSPLFAQKTAEDYLGSWYTLAINHRFTEQFSITPYAELHTYETTSNYHLIFASINFNYHFKPKQTLSIAYAFLDIDSVFGDDNLYNTKENRIYEQYNYKHKLGAFSAQHRFRLEQRFLQFAHSNTMQNRLRYLFSLQYNLTKKMSLHIKEEPFINFQDQVFHENRFFIGIGYQAFKNAQLNIDYFKHHINKKSLNRIQIGISMQTDFRKTNTAKPKG
ncbi:DUF2490 domain-containing protein [Lacinutrix sp. C3R15]|uniref:DUF2490 domain-containing protein n=1 Tax=Flavobacteriaceae TaxID=49546 RepID=UPI001C087A4E|nr:MULTISPECIES: DUF2490 domain-containing protein [Flavobacteriaceae]MBU2940574.1 DUF2490 domain-containing protein [Lacinutrix sp. C3R15]MDO6623892.1 DUF2490 domain-containing protein [Oceanihabitans sp. 1_MG-2023]